MPGAPPQVLPVLPVRALPVRPAVVAPEAPEARAQLRAPAAGLPALAASARGQNRTPSP